jgi:predicted enzyme related to lactoylglutathione lyase
MTELKSHVPGSFCWPELVTTDRPGAVAFYRGLFGWEVDEQPMGPGEIYSTFQMRGYAVAAAHSLSADARARGVQPHWNSYASVASADDSAKRAEHLGATVKAAPFDVMDFGRMAVLQDPTGAAISLWQPKKHIGVHILNEPGALCWTELITSDPPRAEKFYTQLFGWTAKTSDIGGMSYTEFSNQGETLAGMMKIRPEWGNVPAQWFPYFQVTDTDQSAKKATQLRGRVQTGPQDIPNVGRFAMLGDPVDAGFAVFTRAGK